MQYGWKESRFNPYFSLRRIAWPAIVAELIASRSVRLLS